MATPASISPPSNRVYWPYLDGLRCLAFTLVFMYHLPGVPPQTGRVSKAIAEGYNAIAHWGWMGVDLFFVLSAFLITYLLMSEQAQFGSLNLRAFYTRRILRIWPLYFFALLLGFVLFPLLVRLLNGEWNALLIHNTQTYLPWFLLFLGNFALTIQPATGLLAILPSLWSICVEEQFYLVWGWLLKYFPRLRVLLPTLALAFVLNVAGRWFCQAHGIEWNINTFTRLDPLIGGILLAFLYRYHKEQLEKLPCKWLFLLASLALLAVPVCLLPFVESNTPSSVWALSLIALAWTLFLLSVITMPFLQKVLAHPLLARVGRITYGMYVFHTLSITLAVLIGRLWLNTPDPTTNWLQTALLALVLTLVLASISWTVLEKPFIRKKPGYSRILSGFASGEEPASTDKDANTA